MLNNSYDKIQFFYQQYPVNFVSLLEGKYVGYLTSLVKVRFESFPTIIAYKIQKYNVCYYVEFESAIQVNLISVFVYKINL